MSVFAPRPPNDFEAFFEAYYAECRARVPAIEAIGAKWAFEDLIPGLSDFDTRFLVHEGMSVEGWCAMSDAVGAVHLEMCRRHPHWARNLEHLPGINLTWSEILDPESYYPEVPQWTWHRTTRPDRLAALEDYLAQRPWDAWDEYFHLDKFCLFFGRYDRRIDPAINLGPFESKYPLHSRYMHYFCPPLQAALSLLERRPVRGKLEALRLARARFPDEPVYAEMQDALDRHYEVPALYGEPGLTHLEDRLEAALGRLRDVLAPRLTLVPPAARPDVAAWKTALKAVAVPPRLKAFSAARFGRLMKGRLRFYAAAPPHFDSVALIQNELRRIRRNFFAIPFGIYWRLAAGETLDDPAPILPRLSPELLDTDALASTQIFARLTADGWQARDPKRLALEIADVYEGFYRAQTRVVQAIERLTAPAGAAP